MWAGGRDCTWRSNAVKPLSHPACRAHDALLCHSTHPWAPPPGAVAGRGWTQRLPAGPCRSGCWRSRRRLQPTSWGQGSGLQVRVVVSHTSADSWPVLEAWACGSICLVVNQWPSLPGAPCCTPGEQDRSTVATRRRWPTTSSQSMLATGASQLRWVGVGMSSSGGSLDASSWITWQALAHSSLTLTPIQSITLTA